MASKTLAALRGRDYVAPDDIKALVAPVFRHRVYLRPEAEIEGSGRRRRVPPPAGPDRSAALTCCTRRFFGLALICPALLVLAEFLPFLTPLALVYGIGLLALLWLDWRHAGPGTQFRLAREHDQKLSLGAQNRIAIRVTARTARPRSSRCATNRPICFVGSESAMCQSVISPGETVVLDYLVRPLRRGDFAFGDLNVRWSGPLRFCQRQAVIPAAETVKVYPNLHEIHKYDLLVRRDQLAEMGLRNIRRAAKGRHSRVCAIIRPTIPTGASTGRPPHGAAKPISTDYEPERSQRVIALLDVGRMMRSPIRVDDPGGVSWNMAKLDFVLNSVLLFSYVATLKGDQVGLLVFADQVQQFIAPAAGRAHFQKLLETMYALDSQPVEADYGRALNYLSAHLKKRALVVLFTDLSGARASESLRAICRA